MLYVGIDQHKRHLTICIREEQGNIMLRRQVKTEWERVLQFLQQLQIMSTQNGGYVSVMEVCGFNGWLIDQLQFFGCQRVYVIAPPSACAPEDRPAGCSQAERAALDQS